jgi:predicted permease
MKKHPLSDLDTDIRDHIERETQDNVERGMLPKEARYAALRKFGNVTLHQEDVRAVWISVWLDQLRQDVGYALRSMVKNPAFTTLVALSLALGIGANTAIFSFMDSILLRSLPVTDPASLVVVKWRSRPFNFADGADFVMQSIDGRTYRDAAGTTAAIFPYPAFEHLQEASNPVLSSIFAYHPAGNVNVRINGEAEFTKGEYVSGEYFRGLAVSPAAGRLITTDDDRVGAPPVAVVSMAYNERRFGGAEAVGQPILINNVPFTVIGVTPREFFGVDPAVAPDVYLPMRVNVTFDPKAAGVYLARNSYWLQIMGRLRPGVRRDQAQAALAAPFAQWVVTTATNEAQRANLPVLWLDEGAGGLDSLRRQYSKPLYVLLAMVGLILAIACANTANLLLARATARRREIAVRLSIGAGRWRVVRQLLTESILLASLSGALGILVALAGIGILTRLLANGQDGFTLHAELNWHVLLMTLGLSCLCGLLFGLAPAIRSTRPALMPTLKEARVIESRSRVRAGIPHLNLTQALVVAQVAISLLLLIAAGLFVRTLSNLQSIQLGFNRENVLLFELNAPQAGLPESQVADFYDGLRRRLSTLPGVRDATLSHASLIRAGRQLPIAVNGVPAEGVRILGTGPAFFTTMRIPILVGRELDERDRRGSLPVAVVSDAFARTYFGHENPVGRHIRLGGRSPLDLEIVGIAATARYGGLKAEVPPVVYISYAQVTFPPLRQMTYALRTEDDPLRYVSAVRQAVQAADARVPITNVKTQATEIDQTINQEIVFAKLCSAFAGLALIIAGVGLYGTTAYSVARRTSEIGLRMALGARRESVIWMVLRDVYVLAVLGLAVGLPIALGTSRVIESFLFQTKPNDPATLGFAVVVLLGATLMAGSGPARRASRISPMIALRED